MYSSGVVRGELPILAWGNKEKKGSRPSPRDTKRDRNKKKSVERDS